MHKLNKAQAACFLMLHPEAYRVLYSYGSSPMTKDEAAALLCFDRETFDNLIDAAADESRRIVAAIHASPIRVVEAAR